MLNTTSPQTKTSTCFHSEYPLKQITPVLLILYNFISVAGTVLAASSSTQYLKNSPIPGISTRPALVLKQEPGSQPGTDYVPRWTVTPIFLFFFCALHLSRFMGWRVTLKDLLSSRPVIFSTQMQQLGEKHDDLRAKT